MGGRWAIKSVAVNRAGIASSIINRGVLAAERYAGHFENKEEESPQITELVPNYIVLFVIFVSGAGGK